MAKNLDINIDTGNFLESFRPEMPPPAARKGTEAAATGNSAKGGTVVSKERQTETRGTRQPPVLIESEYLERFIKTSKTPARSGKMVYVRKEYHDRIMRILHVIGKGELSISGYIDHVLTEHFVDYEEAIKKLYKKNYEDVY